MRAKVILCAVACAVVLAGMASVAQADKVILSVPDWNQPTTYGVAGYPSWCSPTAGACLMGYWEDVLAKVKLTDAKVFPLSPPYAANPATYQQGLWNDGTVEMGWYMDTGSWQTNNGPYPPNVGGTQSPNIGPGAVAYAGAGWVDPGTAIVKTAYAASTWKDVLLSPQMWSNYCGEIDNNRPVLVSWDNWVSNMTGVVNINGTPVELWNLGGGTSGGHTVCGVGYYDPTPLAIWSGDERIIAQDNWNTTGQYVAVLVGGGAWTQNDYINVPEPATLSLLALGGLALLRRRNR